MKGKLKFNATAKKQNKQTNKQTKKVKVKKVEIFSKSNQFKNEIEYLGKKTILILFYSELMF